MTRVFSILAQPLGWVQRLTCALWALFQSSLNLLAGCSWHLVIGLDQGCCSFNPHPTSRLGAGGGDHSLSLFQSSSNLLGWRQACRRFNPHPTSRSSAALHRWRNRWRSVLFQSSPNLSVGCSTTPVALAFFGAVSILAQPLGWVQPNGTVHHSSLRFNPHPTFRPGAALGFSLILFQSSPNLWVGCSLRTARWNNLSRSIVSILIQPLGLVQCDEHRQISRLFVVSILTEPIGWVPSSLSSPTSC